MQVSDSTTFELSQTCLKLKDGLRFSIQKSNHGMWYLIEDDARSTFFRVGPVEYTFLSLLDGKTTLANAIATTCTVLEDCDFTEQDAISLCQWLVDSNLAHTNASTTAERMREQTEKNSALMFLNKLNPVSIQFPLIQLDGLATVLNQFFGWLVSIPAAIIWVLVCAYALVLAVMNFDHLGQVVITGRDNFVWMALTWLVLKGIHEMAHLLACKRFGGYVGKGGILLLLMIPMPYVDVTSSWRFSSKYHRIITSFSGMMAEIFIAAIATIVWYGAGAGMIGYHAGNIMMAASLHTLFFNANPLMKFDGYHMLADYVEIPNLANHGNQYVKRRLSWIFFGTPFKPLDYGGKTGVLIRVYGVASLAWKVLLCFVLGIAAINLFNGIGLVMAIFAMGLWLVLPAGKFLKYLVKGSEFHQPDRIQFALMASVLLGFGLVVCKVTPAPSIVKAPVVIDFQSRQIVRNSVGGFVEKIHVDEDQAITKGQLLVTISNPDLEGELIDITARIRSAMLKAQMFRSARDIPSWQNQQAIVRALSEQKSKTEKQIKDLEIVAPRSGMILDKNLHDQVGKFAPPGTELFSIGEPNQKEAIALVSQTDSTRFRDLSESPIRVQIWGERSFSVGHVKEIRATSTDCPPHFAFAGSSGGALEVTDRASMENRKERQIVGTANSDAQMMLLDPYLEMRIGLSESDSNEYQAGQTGVAYVAGNSRNLGDFLIHSVTSWFADQVKLNHGF